MDRAIKNIINKLECPLCKSQIDGIELHKLYCVANRNHYHISMYENPILIESEKIRFSDRDYITDYTIVRKYTEEGKFSLCTITIEKTGLSHSKHLTINFDPLNLNPFSIEKAIERIKNIFIFQ